MAKIGSLTADLKLESAAFIRDMRRAAQETARNTSAMQRSMAGLNKSFDAVGASLKTFVLGFVGLKGLQFIANIVKMADEVGDTAVRLGVGSEELQRFRLAGEQAGVSVNEMDTALKLFQKNLAAGKIQAEGDSIAEKFGDVLEQIRLAPTVSKEIEISTKAATKSFGVMLALSRMGKDEFEAWARSAAVFSNEALKAADDLDKQWRAFTNSLLVPFGTGFLEGLTGGLALTEEQLKKLQKMALEAGKEIGAFIKTTIKEIRALIKFGGLAIDEINKASEIASHATESRLRAKGLIPPKAEGELVPTTPLGPNVKIEEIAKPLGEAAKTTEQLRKEQEALNHEWEVATTVVKNELTPAAQELHDTLENVGEMAASAFADAIVEGKNFQETINELMKDVAKMIIQLLLMKAIKASIDAGFSGATGVPTEAFHGGGIVGRDGGPMRNLSPLAFTGAPRFHNGMMPGEFPAVLKKGEGVFTPEQMKAIGGGNVQNNFTVINQAPNTKVEEERRENPSGGMDITAIIRQTMTKEVSDPASSVHKSMKSTFGLSQSGVRR